MKSERRRVPDRMGASRWNLSNGDLPAHGFLPANRGANSCNTLGGVELLQNVIVRFGFRKLHPVADLVSG
jgi:hypothetical protein